MKALFRCVCARLGAAAADVRAQLARLVERVGERLGESERVEGAGDVDFGEFAALVAFADSPLEVSGDL